MTQQLWLGRRLREGEQGFYLSGDCGTDRIVVELDHSVFQALPHENREVAVSDAHWLIQAAARRKWSNGEAYPHYHFHSDRLKHKVIALTNEDLEPDPKLS